MDNITNIYIYIYVDSRYKLQIRYQIVVVKFEIQEALDLPDNTICYIDDISIPHTWYSI